MIDTLHIELTTFCNAACPSCNRTLELNKNQRFPLIHLDFEKIYNIQKEVLTKFKKIQLCGSYGDPLLHPKFFDFVDYFIKNTDAYIEISTNGNPHKSEWWKTLAKKIGNRGYVIFGIDGLENTHSIYRKKTDFNTIITNASTFINNSGRAWWQFIPFKHNENDIIKAKKLSQKLKFEKFFLKDERHPDIFESWSKSKVSFDSEQTLETIADRCLFKKGTIYLRADGNFFPCCYFGDYSKNSFSFTILNNETINFIDNNLEKSWQKENTTPNECLYWCVKRKLKT